MPRLADEVPPLDMSWPTLTSERLPLPLPEPPPVVHLQEQRSSSSLFLTGLGSLGALQLGRSARRLQWGRVPGWLHGQRSHLIDPEWTGAPTRPVLAPVTIDRPAEPRRSLRCRGAAQYRPCMQRDLVCVIRRRGPPAAATQLSVC